MRCGHPVASPSFSRDTGRPPGPNLREIGAGVIFKEGLNVRGLNTAATLWCSAAIGILAGAGAIRYAAIATAMIIFVNLLLRPLIFRINAQSLDTSELSDGFKVEVVCKSPQEAHIRALLLQGLASEALHLRQLESANIEDSGRVEIAAVVAADNMKQTTAIGRIVGRLSLEPSVTGAGWRREALAV